MKTFKFKNHVRDCEYTQLVFAQSETNPDPKYWQESEEKEILKKKCAYLWKQGDVKYYGYM